MAILVDADDRPVDNALTRAPNGAFELLARGPGTYRIRAERIGYATTLSDPFTLDDGDTLAIQVAARVEAISLRGIDAHGERRCEVRPGEGLAVAMVWDEARKALAAAAWTERRGMYEYELLRIKRQYDRRGERIESESRTRAGTAAAAPYVALPPDSLVSGGFARFSADASLFWAPDADVLLSDPFLDTHCFRIRENDDRPDLIGLDFEPIPGRGVPDVAGTMWLDVSSADLQWLEFRYVTLGVPRWLTAAEPGGRVEFRALPNGTWIVTSWHIRMFTPGETEHRRTGELIPTLEGVSFEVGKVLAAHDGERVVFEGDRGYRVVGTVVDSLGVGLSDARVFVEGAGAEAVTDSLGRYELVHLGVGEYSIHFSHPYLEQFWYLPDPEEVRIGPRRPNPVQLDWRAPPVSDVLDDICRDSTPPRGPVVATDRLVWRHGIVTGHVVDADGNPADDATAHVLTKAYDPQDLMDLMASTRDSLDLDGLRIRAKQETNAAGFFRFCWLPMDVPLEIVVLDRDERMDEDAFEEALSLAALYPDRTWVISVDRERPYRTVNVELRSR